MDMDNTVTVGAWARSRGIPRSTAYAAAQDGRLALDTRGRVILERADREWPLLRVDTPVPRVPGGEATPDPDVERAVKAIRRATGDPEWAGDPGDEMVSVQVAEAVLTYEMAVRTVAENEVMDSLAPVLARMRTPGEVRMALRDALNRASEIADERLRRDWAGESGPPVRLEGDETKGKRPRVFPFGSMPRLAALLDWQRQERWRVEREREREAWRWSACSIGTESASRTSQTRGRPHAKPPGWRAGAFTT